MKHRIVGATFLFVAVAILFAQDQHHSAFTGTWKLNVEKSKYPNGMTPQRASLRFLEDGTTMFSVVSSEGKVVEWSFPWSDGKPVPIEGATMTHHETTVESVHGRKWMGEIRANGKTNTTIDATVSDDGKTMTGVITYIDPDGHRTSHTEVYDRQ